MGKADLKSALVGEPFWYRGVECEIRRHEISPPSRTLMRSIEALGAMMGNDDMFALPDDGQHVHCGYMTANWTVNSYDEADEVASAHGGFTYFEHEPDGRKTLGFDTAHYFDGPHTQNEDYVASAIRDAVDSLIAARAVETDTEGRAITVNVTTVPSVFTRAFEEDKS